MFWIHPNFRELIYSSSIFPRYRCPFRWPVAGCAALSTCYCSESWETNWTREKEGSHFSTQRWICFGAIPASQEKNAGNNKSFKSCRIWPARKGCIRLLSWFCKVISCSDGVQWNVSRGVACSCKKSSSIEGSFAEAVRFGSIHSTKMWTSFFSLRLLWRLRSQRRSLPLNWRWAHQRTKFCMKHQAKTHTSLCQTRRQQPIRFPRWKKEKLWWYRNWTSSTTSPISGWRARVRPQSPLTLSWTPNVHSCGAVCTSHRKILGQVMSIQPPQFQNLCHHKYNCHDRRLKVHLTRCVVGGPNNGKRRVFSCLRYDALGQMNLQTMVVTIVLMMTKGLNLWRSNRHDLSWYLPERGTRRATWANIWYSAQCTWGQTQAVNPKLSTWSRKLRFFYHHSFSFFFSAEALWAAADVFGIDLYEFFPDASCRTLSADVPTFSLEGVSGTTTLVVVVDKETGSCLGGVTGAKTDCLGEAIISGAALFARTGHPSSDVSLNPVGAWSDFAKPGGTESKEAALCTLRC